MLMKDKFQIDMSRIEELESKELLTSAEFKELGHFRMSTGEWSIGEAMQHGITLEESKKRVEEVVYNHFHSRVCAS